MKKFILFVVFFVVVCRFIKIDILDIFIEDYVDVIFDGFDVKEEEDLMVYQVINMVYIDFVYIKFEVFFDWVNLYMKGVEMLMVKFYFYLFDSFIFDVKVMEINFVFFNGKMFNYFYNDDKLCIKFDKIYM